MGIVGYNWYAQGESTAYPLDEGASLRADDGSSWPVDVLADISLRWDSVYGEYAFISGLTVTSRIVTCVIAATSALDSTDAITIAAISLSPADTAGMVPLKPLQPGVAGFIAFGDTSEPITARASTAKQTRLCRRVAQASHAKPLVGVQKAGSATALSGPVRLIAGNNCRIRKESLEWFGSERDAIVISAVPPAGDVAFLGSLAGACGKRPESHTCDKPGAQRLNGQSPDCAGNINIEFRGLTASPLLTADRSAAGVVLDQPLTLSDVCSQKNAVIRFRGESECLPSTSQSSSEASESTSGSTSASPSETTCDLPFSDCFSGSRNLLWADKRGEFGFVTSGLPVFGGCAGNTCLVSQSTGSLNLSIVDCTIATTDLAVYCSLARAFSTKLVGGLIFGYELIDDVEKYWMLSLDYNTNKILLQRYTGSLLLDVAVVHAAYNLNSSDWHNLTVVVSKIDANWFVDCVITADDQSHAPITLAHVTSSFPTTCNCGIYSDRAALRFSNFGIGG